MQFSILLLVPLYCFTSAVMRNTIQFQAVCFALVYILCLPPYNPPLKEEQTDENEGIYFQTRSSKKKKEEIQGFFLKLHLFKTDCEHLRLQVCTSCPLGCEHLGRNVGVCQMENVTA